MKIIVIISVMIMYILVPNKALSYDTESWNKLTRQCCFLSLLYKDYLQTRDISKTEGLYEKNKLLGRNPKKQEIIRYFSACAIGHSLISYYLEGKYAEVWQLTWIGVQASVTGDNLKLGIKNRVDVRYSMKYKITF